MEEVAKVFLDFVKQTLRIKTDAYDMEIETHIKACLYDLDRLNISYDFFSPEPEIQTIVSVYVKSKFGNGNTSEKQAMESVYKELRTTLLLDKSHRRVS